MSAFDPSSIPVDDDPPWLKSLLSRLQELEEENARLKEENARLKDEISKLKRLKKPPRIPSSSLEKPKRTRNERHKNKCSIGKRVPKQETRVIYPDQVPKGSRFKGYKKYTVQELSIQALNITFKLGVYVTPEGKIIRAELPKQYASGHFGPELVAHCLSISASNTVLRSARGSCTLF